MEKGAMFKYLKGARFPSRVITDEEKEAAEEEWMDLKLYMTRPNKSFKDVKEGYQKLLNSQDTEHLGNIKLLCS